MEDKKMHLRHVMLYYYKKGKNASQTCRKICSVYGDNVLAESTVRKWFVRFKSEIFDLKDKDRCGRPSIVDEDPIQNEIENDPHSTTRSIAETLQISHMSVGRHLKKLEYINRYDIWIPHNLNENQLMVRVSICSSLLIRNKRDPFLRRTITGDEKWVIFDNPKRKRSWTKVNEPPLTIPKAELHPKKVMLCIWWDWKGVIYYELLPQGQTLNSIKYCSQLDRLKAAIHEKRPSLANRNDVIFHQDNARPHVSLMTQQKIAELGWEQLSHPPYSPDLAPSDFHLFRSLQNFLAGKKLTSLEHCKTVLDEYIGNKDAKFWEEGFIKLPERWSKVVEQNGIYLTD